MATLSQEHGFMIVADEVYHLLGYGEAPPAPLASLWRANVLSVGSFSKILAPGLRLG
ncbi:MAG: aminotransferase class I/II-fold pyridoxal phosphate-dependent enzyme [Caldilineaceae bacterium]